jgi:hypothetical protein
MNECVFFDCQRVTDETKRKFYDRFGVPVVIGCVDGTHVKLLRPSQHEADYVNRKGYHSLNVQLIVILI